MGQDSNPPKHGSVEKKIQSPNMVDEDQLADQLAQLHERVRAKRGETLKNAELLELLEPLGTDAVPSNIAQNREDLPSMVEILMVLEKMKPMQAPAPLENPVSQIETHPHFCDHTESEDPLLDPAEIGSLAAPIGSTTQTAAGPQQNQLDGLRIGRFRVGERIGQGGYGLVFRAYDDRLERDVALKIPSPEATLSLDQRRRFLREGRAAAALSHPNIVGVLDAGEETAICYLASEFIDGVNLAKWKEQRGKLALQQIATLVSALAEAVQHAHSRQVLHRDLKPSNVLMKGDKPMISDFGLALRLDEDTSLITGDSIIGTPAFMAPEQAMGKLGTVDHRADVYGLGGILYFLLTDQPPLLGSSTWETLEWVRSREPVAPRTIDPTIPADLQSICLKCLEKEPARRYASAHKLYLDLERFKEGLPVLARAVTSRERLFRWARRNPILSSALTSSVFFMLVSLVTSAVGWISTSRALEVVKQANITALAAQKQSDLRFLNAKQTVDQFYVQVATERLLNVPGMTSLRRELLESALHYYVQFLEEAGDDQSLLHDIERAHYRMGEILADLGKPTDALKHFRQSARLLEQLLNSLPDGFSHQQDINLTQSRIAKLQMTMGQPDEALTGMKNAIDRQQKLLLEKPDDLEVLDQLARMWQQQAIFQRELRQPNEAQQTLLTVVDLRQQLLQADPENTDYLRELLTSQGNLANALRGAGQLAAAKELTGNVITGLRALVSDSDATPVDHHSLLKTLYNRSLLSMAMRQSAEAKGFLEEACSLAEQLAMMFPAVEAHVRDPALMRSALAVACLESGNIEQALESFKLAESAFQRVVALNPDSIENRIDHALAKLNYGAALGNHTQQYSAGEELINSSRGLLAEVLVLSPGNFNAQVGLINSHINLAAFAIDVEDWDVAQSRSSDALELLGEISAEHGRNPQVRHACSQAYVNLAKSLENLDRWAEAAEAWQAVVELAFPQPDPVYKLRHAAALARADRLLESAKLVLEIEMPLPDSPALLLQHGRCHALLARGYRMQMLVDGDDRSGMIDQHVQSAIQSLQRARTLGHFASAKRKLYLETSADLDELRQHPDFDGLLQDH